jgi:DNA modification methylase
MKLGKIEVTNEDNMIMMARYPDKYFDLAIVDPPYGIGEDGNKAITRGKPFEPKGLQNSKSKALAFAIPYKPFSGNDLTPPPRVLFQGAA